MYAYYACKQRCEDMRPPPASSHAPAFRGVYNSATHAMEWGRASRLAISGGMGPQLQEAWNKGGQSKWAAFKVFVDNKCNVESTEASLVIEKINKKELMQEGEFFNEPDLRDMIKDPVKFQAHIDLCRRRPGMVIKDPNDGVTDKFFFSLKQKITNLQIMQDITRTNTAVMVGDATNMIVNDGDNMFGQTVAAPAAQELPLVTPKAKAKSRAGAKAKPEPLADGAPGTPRHAVTPGGSSAEDI
jgi:hypothetical protein